MAIAESLWSLGLLAIEHEQLKGAERLMREMLAILQDTGDRFAIAGELEALGRDVEHLPQRTCISLRGDLPSMARI